MTKKKNKKLSFMNKILFTIQVIMSVSLFGVIMYFQILPLWLLLVIGLVLAGLSYLVYFSFNQTKRSKLNLGLAKALSIVISIVLIVGNILGFNAIGALGKVSGANYKIDAVSVIVKKEAEFEDISDLSDKLFGIHASNDLDNTNYAIDSINDKISNEIRIENRNDFNTLVDALYNDEVDAIILNEAFRGIVEETYPDFDNETRVLFQVEKKTEVKTEVQKGFDVTEEPFNVYLSGIDTYGPVSTTSRSDVNMIITVNPKSKQVLLTNIPRDYYVPLACKNNAMDKLTHAGVYGVDCSVKTLENFMDIDIAFYARVNFSSLINVVDALGGIEVYSEYTFTAKSGEQFYTGMNQMDGNRALAFSRERKALPGGDRDRGRNQQAVIQGIINKAKSPAIVSNYTKVVDAVSGSFQTNMSTQDISKLIKMQLSDMMDWTIVNTSLNGSGATMTTYSYGAQPLYVMIPDMATVSDAQAKITSIIKSSVIIE